MRQRLYDDDSSTGRCFTEPTGRVLRHSRPRPSAARAEPYGNGTSAPSSTQLHQIASILIRHFMASGHRVSVKWPHRRRSCCAEYTHPPTPRAQLARHAPVPSGTSTFLASTVRQMRRSPRRPTCTLAWSVRNLFSHIASLQHFHFLICSICPSCVVASLVRLISIIYAVRGSQFHLPACFHWQ